ncbi:MAG: hypothetical protein AVDCRST_MAG15-1016 [uncultured Rubellimicrobium sp.]|uniref:Uncharacterized protein n=1 Tax=uncultured Rubellimicrobium sp. TaxID=543078 RepID=A0A6J4NA35_9RHOB|nr:MAG: hypothetical protein AVDCRST_MAG15-1016 [uncultured Rubellimicrobium sp.]
MGRFPVPCVWVNGHYAHILEPWTAESEGLFGIKLAGLPTRSMLHWPLEYRRRPIWNMLSGLIPATAKPSTTDDMRTATILPLPEDVRM